MKKLLTDHLYFFLLLIFLSVILAFLGITAFSLTFWGIYLPVAALCRLYGIRTRLDAIAELKAKKEDKKEFTFSEAKIPELYGWSLDEPKRKSDKEIHSSHCPCTRCMTIRRESKGSIRYHREEQIHYVEA